MTHIAKLVSKKEITDVVKGVFSNTDVEFKDNVFSFNVILSSKRITTNRILAIRDRLKHLGYIDIDYKKVETLLEKLNIGDTTKVQIPIKYKYKIIFSK